MAGSQATKKKRLNRSSSFDEGSKSQKQQSSITDFIQPTTINTIEETNNNTKLLLDEISDLKRALEEIQQKQMEIVKENKELKEENFRLKEGLNDLEQYTRRANIRVFGLKGDKDESATESERLVCKLFQEKLGVSVQGKDIDIAHRTGRPVPGKPRQIIVKFMSRKMKEAVMRDRRKLKGSGIVIAEDLTATNAQLYATCRRDPQFSAVWTKNGRTIALGHNGKIETVNASTYSPQPQVHHAQHGTLRGQRPAAHSTPVISDRRASTADTRQTSLPTASTTRTADNQEDPESNSQNNKTFDMNPN